jgi:hypothetical protein
LAIAYWLFATGAGAGPNKPCNLGKSSLNFPHVQGSQAKPLQTGPNTVLAITVECYRAMKAILSLSIVIILASLSFAADSPRAFPPNGDWRDLVTTNSEWAEKLKQSKVPTEEDAKRKTFELLTDARSSPRVSALLRLARKDKDLGEVGDFVWEVRVLWGSDVADVIWVSSTTGKAKRLFPA